MNPVETSLAAVAITTLLIIVAVVVLFSVFHRKIDQLYNALADRVHDVETAIAGLGEKIAVIHHVAVAQAAPATTAPATAPAPGSSASGKN